MAKYESEKLREQKVDFIWTEIPMAIVEEKLNKKLKYTHN